MTDYYNCRGCGGDFRYCRCSTQGIEAGTGETERLDTKCESPSPNGGAPDWQARAERAEAECKELRERLNKPVRHIDADKLHETLKLFETRAKSQDENFVAPIMAGALKLIAEAVKQSTTKGS